MSHNNNSDKSNHSHNSSHSLDSHHSHNSSKKSFKSSSYQSSSSIRQSYSSKYRSRSRDYSHTPRKVRSRENSGLPKIFITKLSHQVTEKDIEKEFKIYGEIRNINLKRGYAFVEYYSKRDAKDAIRKLDNQKLFGQNQRVVVEEAIGYRRDRDRERSKERDHHRRNRYYHDKYRDRDKYRNEDNYSSRHRSRKTGPKESDICFNCGKCGHWANECHMPKKDK